MEFHHYPPLPTTFYNSPYLYDTPKFRCILFCETVCYKVSVDDNAVWHFRLPPPRKKMFKKNRGL